MDKNKKERVNLRKRKMPSGNTSLYLDVFIKGERKYEYLKLYRELAHKQSTQRSKGRKVNAMDAYFYQMAERTLREELAVAFHETPEAAARRLEAAVS